MSSLGSVAHSDPSRSFVSITARSVAGMRAKESARPDGLINDPYAAALAGPEGDAWLVTLPKEYSTFLVNMLAVRTKFIDEFITQAVAQPSGPSQLVILGSGLDTRAQRLPACSVVVTYEVDFSEVHEYKSKVLAENGGVAKGRLVSVAADLSQPTWAALLTAAGFDRTQPTLWILEGLTGSVIFIGFLVQSSACTACRHQPVAGGWFSSALHVLCRYLTEPEVTGLFTTIRGLSCAGSLCLATFLGTEREVAGPGSGKSTIHTFFCDTGDEFVARCGWQHTTLNKLGDIAAKYGREGVPPEHGYFIVTAGVDRL